MTMDETTGQVPDVLAEDIAAEAVADENTESAEAEQE